MRQFIASRAPDRGGNLVISDSKDYKYLCRVLRLSVSDSIAVRLPDGGLCAMTVSAIDAKTKTVVLSRQPDVQGVCVSCGAETGVQAMQVERDTAGSAVTYWLFQFLPKIQKMDTIIRQAVETGIAHIVPVLGAFSPPVQASALVLSSTVPASAADRMRKDFFMVVHISFFCDSSPGSREKNNLPSFHRIPDVSGHKQIVAQK